jgi:plasmid stabilization system protein ParE
VSAIAWTEPALGDLESIGATLARDSEAFARRVMERLLEAVERVVSVPRIGRVVREVGDERVRELLFQTFRIVYRAEPDRILVLSVLLGGQPGDRREPRRWEVV